MFVLKTSSLVVDSSQYRHPKNKTEFYYQVMRILPLNNYYILASDRELICQGEKNSCQIIWCFDTESCTYGYYSLNTQSGRETTGQGATLKEAFSSKHHVRKPFSSSDYIALSMTVVCILLSLIVALFISDFKR